MTTKIPLTDAAKRLSISRERAWRALLNGHLEEEKRDVCNPMLCNAIREHGPAGTWLASRAFDR